MTGLVDLSHYAAVILDFDGPMCHVFAGYPAATVADELRQLLTGLGWPGEALPTTSDPMRFLPEVHRCSPVDFATVEARLAAAELEAVESAPETDGLGGLLHHLDCAGVSIAVASNNHGSAIERWLDRSGYADLIRHVAGRQPQNPGLMKPNPYVLIQATHDLDLSPARCCYVGDSVTDVHAADAARMPFVAMANKPHKHQLFTDHGCRVVVSKLSQLVPTTVEH